MNPTDILVLFVIASYNTNGQSCYLGNKGLCEQLNISKSTLSRTVTKLQSNGYLLDVSLNKSETGEYRRAQYEISQKTIDLYDGVISEKKEEKRIDLSDPKLSTGGSAQRRREKLSERRKPTKNGISYPVKEETVMEKNSEVVKSSDMEQELHPVKKKEDSPLPPNIVEPVQKEDEVDIKKQTKEPMTEEEKLKDYCVKLRDLMYAGYNVGEQIKKMTTPFILRLIKEGNWTMKEKHTIKDYKEVLDLLLKEKSNLIDDMKSRFIAPELFNKLRFRPGSNIPMTENDVDVLISMSGLPKVFGHYFKSRIKSISVNQQLDEFKKYVDEIRGKLESVKASYSKELMYDDVRYTGGL